jgi:branched-chain amino acid transport system substrate-binding protein
MNLKQLSNQMRVAVLTGFMGASMAHASELVFGHISSTTHPSSAFNAKELQAGIKLAFDAANASGGVNGNQIKLDARDDGLDAVKMIAMTNEFAQDDKVIGLIGYLNTGGLSELSKADTYRKLGIAMVAPYQGNPAIVEAANVYPFRSGYNDEVMALLNEAKRSYKSKIAVVFYNLAFGPPMSKFAVEQAGKMQLPVTDVLELDSRPTGDIQGSVDRAVAALKKSRPDAVILVGAGKAAMDFIGAIKKTELASAQIYSMSVIVPDALVATVGEKAARGVVLAQATPYPYTATTRIVSEYQRANKKLTPTKAPSFAHLEGYIAGRIALIALKNAGNKPTRQSLLKALNSMGSVDLGGPVINYSDKARLGWRQTELVIFGHDGKLVR